MAMGAGNSLGGSMGAGGGQQRPRYAGGWATDPRSGGGNAVPLGGGVQSKVSCSTLVLVHRAQLVLTAADVTAGHTRVAREWKTVLPFNRYFVIRVSAFIRQSNLKYVMKQNFTYLLMNLTYV
jgi:hypothetical protein